MEENGLELSLGLSCGGTSAKSKGKNAGSSDVGTDESDRGSKIIDDFKNFLHGGNQRQDLGAGSSRSGSMTPKENFFNDLSQVHIDGDDSLNLKDMGIGTMKNENPLDIQGETQPGVGNKRKILFEEINFYKNHEGQLCQNGLEEKVKSSHVSTTEDGSAAENEDVGESELEGSTSRPGSQIDSYAELGNADLSGQKRSKTSSANEAEVPNFSRSVPLSVQATTMLNVVFPPQLNEAHLVGAPSTTAYSQSIRQVLRTGNCERSGVQPINHGNLPLMFGSSSGQLPTLDKDNSCGFMSYPQLRNPYSDRSQSSSGIPPNSAEQYDARTLELAKVDSRQQNAEEGSSSQAGVKGSSGLGVTERSTAGLPSPHELSAIKPGLTADIKFGGSGSFPNLPWVSTTGSGPNGRTISGVTYRYNANQVKIVCACHGTHMSPEEFVWHASEEHAIAENDTGLAAFPNKNPSNSGQS